MIPTFSIIIPHKGIPDLLMRCLKSIPVSEDIQVIVVDDNSADADTYSDKYPELSRPYLEFVRTTKGGGAGYARNVGLEHAEGKWILFADADDFFVEDMYDIICSYADSEADVIFFKNKSVFSNNLSIECNRGAYRNKIIDQYLADGDEWSLRAQMYGPVCKMVKRSLVAKHNIRFDEIMCYEDHYCSLLIGCNAFIIKAVDKVLYVITYRPNSLSYSFENNIDGLRIKADVYFRSDKLLIQYNMCRERTVVKYLLLLLQKDRPLFEYYLRRIDEIYPTKFSALRDISKKKSLSFKIKFYLYSFMVWTKIL